MTRKFGFLLCFLLAFVMVAAIPPAADAQVAVGISVRIGPPPLRVYAQPICPGVGYIWTPGYWAYGDDGYYWVPGTWILAPQPGFLWTPGYWGWGGGVYLWHVGYWGPHVGFYGGINYGFGYSGVGFWGGEWRGGRFYYNRSVTNVNVNIHNTYNRTVIVNNNTHVSYNGGEGGVRATPTRQEMAAEHEQHIQPTAEQTSHRDMAQNNRANRFDAARDNRAVREDNRAVREDNRAVREDNRAVRNDNRANRNENRQMKQNKQNHNQKNNHPQREGKPGRGR